MGDPNRSYTASLTDKELPVSNKVLAFSAETSLRSEIGRPEVYGTTD